MKDSVDSIITGFSDNKPYQTLLGSLLTETSHVEEWENLASSVLKSRVCPAYLLAPSDPPLFDFTDGHETDFPFGDDVRSMKKGLHVHTVTPIL